MGERGQANESLQAQLRSQDEELAALRLRNQELQGEQALRSVLRMAAPGAPTVSSIFCLFAMSAV